MPTGYTMPIHDGKDVTFQQFAMRCARGMMALVTLRDEPLDAEAPAKLVPSQYHENCLTEAKARLVQAERMTDSEAERSAAAEYANETARREKHERESLELRTRYLQMLGHVMAWEPPTDQHVGLRDFMRDQLLESIKFDCATLDWTPVKKSGTEFKSATIAAARRDVEYHERELGMERARCDERNAWLRALRASLGEK